MKLTEVFKSHTSPHKIISKPYIIAEAGVNHEGSMDIAKRLIEEAKEGGAHAIKFQTYKAETLASKNSPSYWDLSKETTTSQFELFKKHDKFWKKEFEELKKYCNQTAIEFLSTPFDLESATFLNDLMEVFKISSSDLNNLPFIEYICQFKKPILLSTGASYLWEIQRTVDIIEKHELPICLLHCILNYPTEDQNANLGMIVTLKEKFPNLFIGYSDHTLPEKMEVLNMATLLGAQVLEKHFTHDKTLPGNDHYHAMDKHDLKLLIQRLNYTATVLGSFEKWVLPSEETSRKNARRSLVAVTNLAKGTVVERKHLTFKRPAFGISPEFMDQVIGKEATQDITADTILQWHMFK